MPLITWEDVAARYKDVADKRDATQGNSAYVYYAVAELNSRLSSRYTVPFSDNNVTAKDLAIDLSVAKIYRYNDPKKSAAINSYVGWFVDELISGRAAMYTTSGGLVESVGDTIYSTTQTYHPVFGMSSPYLWEVDSAQVIAEEGARGRFY